LKLVVKVTAVMMIIIVLHLVQPIRIRNYIVGMQLPISASLIVGSLKVAA